MKGYRGKIIRVNLTELKCTVENLDPEVAKKYIGGRGFGIKVLLDEVDPKVDPLGPENKIIIASGPLVGAKVICASRYMVITKSPLNHGIAHSNAGGHWSAELKFAGYDAIIIEGKAEKPVYLYIEGDKIQLLDAADIWGKLSSETTDYLVEKHGNCKVLNIGPAGENLSKMAAVINDKHRAAGRCGTGAVLGSKNLKAIAVKAVTRKLPVADEEALDKIYKELLPFIRKDGASYTNNGTLGIFNLINENGVFPTHNYQSDVCDAADKIDSRALNEHYLVKKEACFRCPLACGRVSRVEDNVYSAPEYEAVWAFGPNCGVNDLGPTIVASHLCNEYGLDIISTGATIAAAMELYQRGFIKDEEVNGPALVWGNKEAVTGWVELIGRREGLGDKMANGSYELCESYGVPEYSMTVKKLEMPAYDARGLQGQGLSYATANRGGCHVTGNVIVREIMSTIQGGVSRTSTENKEEWVISAQDKKAAVDSLGLCGFGAKSLTTEQLVEMYNAATGLGITVDEFLQAGTRIYNAERLFSVRSAGYSSKDDRLPQRLLEEPIKRGPSAGQYNRLPEMLPKYYAARGWDQNGVPTEAKIKELGIE